MVENERIEQIEKAVNATEVLAFSLANTYNTIFKADGWHEVIRDGIEISRGDLSENIFRGIHFQIRGDITYSEKVDDMLSTLRRIGVMHFLAPYYQEVLIKSSTKQKLLTDLSSRKDSNVILPGLIKIANLFDSRLGIE